MPGSSQSAAQSSCRHTHVAPGVSTIDFASVGGRSFARPDVKRPAPHTGERNRTARASYRMPRLYRRKKPKPLCSLRSGRIRCGIAKCAGKGQARRIPQSWYVCGLLISIYYIAHSILAERQRQAPRDRLPHVEKAAPAMVLGGRPERDWHWRKWKSSVRFRAVGLYGPRHANRGRSPGE